MILTQAAFNGSWQYPTGSWPWENHHFQHLCTSWKIHAKPSISDKQPFCVVSVSTCLFSPYFCWSKFSFNNITSKKDKLATKSNEHSLECIQSCYHKVFYYLDSFGSRMLCNLNRNRVVLLFLPSLLFHFGGAAVSIGIESIDRPDPTQSAPAPLVEPF